MAKEKEERDLEKFLKNVDEISTLVQDLNSDDFDVCERAMDEAEKRLQFQEDQEEDECRTTLNKTMISPPQVPTEQVDVDDSNPDAFMKIIENDARERAKRRKENKSLANAFKEKGNEAFLKGDYEMAVHYYTEGLKKLKDMKVLYTNRAQAYMKLEEYEKALVDCEWALKCDENSTKAYFHMGKAHLALKNYSMARQCYQKILEINPKLQVQVKDSLNKVDQKEKAELQEKLALQELKSGKEAAVTTKNLLEALSNADQIPLFYAGGVQLLTELMEDCTEQTLFRTHNGFSIINDNKVIKRCFATEEKDEIEEILCIAVLKLWHAVCTENEENQQLLLTHSDVDVLLPSLLTSKMPSIQQHTLSLLLLFCQTENGRILVLSHMDLTRLLQALVLFVNISEEKECRTAMQLLTDLALEERFKTLIQNNLPALLTLISILNIPEIAYPSTLLQCIAIMGNLSTDAAIRKQMSDCEECWDACFRLMVKCEENVILFRETLYATLGFMMNLSLESVSITEVLAEQVTRKCVSLLNSEDGGILTRAAGVLSRVLFASMQAVEEAVKAGVMKIMIKFLKAGGQTASRYAIKILAVCTNINYLAREEVIRLDKKFNLLIKLLEAEDEIIAGNAALCIGNCVEVPGSASALLKSDIVKILLKLAGGDTKEASVQLNAGIALGKLCTAEPRHTAQLENLHGIEILNSTMKYIQKT
ncbi:tetratricopeptide repeat protein 12 isoform X1 [Antechinus flavipes]|uniref:tetratricopeptide repeat protein 12 isoform X1 n=1 Tax=Antechinus flavipes TaxID=38775 RepID=UPI0022356490|nr:tetratricopeptide repeat protein 12 isoform X1 [Antechinus flavipes]